MDILIKKLNKYNLKYENNNNEIYLHKVNYYKNLINQYGGLQKIFNDIKENIIKLNEENKKSYSTQSIDELINSILDLTKRNNQNKINELDILHQELQKLRKINLTQNITPSLEIPEEKEKIQNIKIKLADIDNDPQNITNLMTEIIIQNMENNDNSKSVVQIMANLIILNKEVKQSIRNKLIEDLPKYNMNYSDVNVSIRNILDERIYKSI